MARKSLRPAGRSTPSRVVVSRAEFEELLRACEERTRQIKDLKKEAAIQFRRIAELQAEVDELRDALRSPAFAIRP